MRVIEISSFGGPEVLRIAERPMPVPGAGEVLIKVAAAGVNRPDVIQRYGKYAPPPGASDIPGLEVSGHMAGAWAGRRAVGGRRRRLRAACGRRLRRVLRGAAVAVPAAARAACH